MLPSINTEYWFELSNDRVLVCIRFDSDLSGLCILDEPSPATALNTGKSSIEILLQGIETSVTVINGLGQRTRWRLATSLALWG